MNNDEKLRFDAIVELCKMSWDRISERRKYEWRVAFAMWGAIGLLIFTIVTGQLAGFNFNNIALTVIIGIAGVAIACGHGMWQNQLHKSFTLDRDMAISYEQKLRELSNAEFPEELLKRLRVRRNEMGKFNQTWAWMLVAITLLLVAMACFVAFSTKAQSSG